MTNGEVDGDLRLTLREAAAFQNISEGRMRDLLREGRIDGADKRMASPTSTKEEWSVPISGLLAYNEAKEEGGGGGGGKPNSTLKVMGLDDTTRPQLEAFVAAHPGLSVGAAYYKPSPEQSKKQREAAKARQKQVRAELIAKGVIDA